jgi:hypothetical protein
VVTAATSLRLGKGTIARRQGRQAPGTENCRRSVAARQRPSHFASLQRGKPVA